MDLMIMPTSARLVILNAPRCSIQSMPRGSISYARFELKSKQKLQYVSVAFKKNLLRGLLHVLFYFDFSDSLQTKRLLLRKLLIITPNQKRVDDDVHDLKIRSKIAYILRQCSALILDRWSNENRQL